MKPWPKHTESRPRTSPAKERGKQPRPEYPFRDTKEEWRGCELGSEAGRCGEAIWDIWKKLQLVVEEERKDPKNINKVKLQQIFRELWKQDMPWLTELTDYLDRDFKYDQRPEGSRLYTLYEAAKQTKTSLAEYLSKYNKSQSAK